MIILIDTYQKTCQKIHFVAGFVFKMPRFRRKRTMNGAENSVILMRTGANTLWIAYAMTNVLAPVVILVEIDELMLSNPR